MEDQRELSVILENVMIIKLLIQMVLVNYVLNIQERLTIELVVQTRVIQTKLRL